MGRKYYSFDLAGLENAVNIKFVVTRCSRLFKRPFIYIWASGGSEEIGVEGIGSRGHIADRRGRDSRGTSLTKEEAVLWAHR